MQIHGIPLILKMEYALRWSQQIHQAQLILKRILKHYNDNYSKLCDTHQLRFHIQLAVTILLYPNKLQIEDNLNRQ